MRKYLMMVTGFLLMGGILCAQGPNLPEVDKSPMDASYFPNNYPILKIQGKATSEPIARIIYSRPQKNNRIVFGNLVEYGKVWRLGANEASELLLYQDVSINNQPVARGRYTLYALVEPESWTIILNKDNDTWGAFKYDEAHDLIRVKVPVQHEETPVEFFSVECNKISDSRFTIDFYWDTTHTSLPVSF